MHANLDVVDQDNVQVVRIVGLTFLPVERGNLFGRPKNLKICCIAWSIPRSRCWPTGVTGPEEIFRILTETAVQLGADPELRLFLARAAGGIGRTVESGVCGRGIPQAGLSF